MGCLAIDVKPKMVKHVVDEDIVLFFRNESITPASASIDAHSCFIA
jgi:hypothetical protein